MELDPAYAKAYYRRGDAAFAMLHFKDAVKDFKAAAKLAPRDPTSAVNWQKPTRS